MAAEQEGAYRPSWQDWDTINYPVEDVKSLGNPEQKYKLTAINTAVTVVLIAVIVVVLLVRAGLQQTRAAEENMINLSGMAAKDIQARYQTYVDIVRTESQIMSNYQLVDVELRRSFFNNTMLGILASNHDIVSIYTLWLPNALDGMDSFYANTEGTDDTGLYIPCYTRESGYVEFRPFREYQPFLDDLPNEEIITSPVPRYVGGVAQTLASGLAGNSLTVDIRIPIRVDANIVGLVGVTVNMNPLQSIVEKIRPYDTGYAMVISNYGTRTIIAHHLPHFRGLNFSLASEEEFGQEGLAVVFDSIRKGQPEIIRTDSTMIVSYPYDIGAIRSPWTVITAVPLSTIRAPIYALIRFSIIFITLAAVVAAGVIFFTSNSLTRRAKSLQYELERAMTMWDNLKYGFFLMDQNLAIQGSYSRALEEILAVPDLRGRQFVETLSSSLKASEQQGLTDYFTMIFQQSFDKKMLEDINPINEFVYVQSGTGKEKHLRSSFTLVERGKGVAYILGTLEDITLEKELERQLSEAESRRENEMRSLFQVIQIDPRVFSDFIEETEHEFDRANEALKNREMSAHDSMVDIYQSIHAIKSNALILNLEDFATSLNDLETQIKRLRDRPEGRPEEPSTGASGDISFDDVLHIIVELEKIMKEKDKLKSAITRIRAFQVDTGNIRNQDRYILEETLTRTCDKAARAMNKKAKFVAGDIDETVLAYGPRLIIKEVLAQLVRNAVYHGIETPEERESRGKAAGGLIKLSIKYIDNMIHIQLADDGEGLDFVKIREKAKTMHMLHGGEETDDRKLLHVIFKPGFTTVEKADIHAGRGIGLSLVRDRIRNLHGSIKVQSIPGKGTIFNICIPMEMPAANKVS